MYYHQTSIKHWAVEDRPREKLLSKGISALTDAELLAIILSTGSREHSAIGLARIMLDHAGGLRQLARSGVEELTQIKGIGKAKAISIVSAFELGRRKAQGEILQTRITSSETAARYLMPKLADLEREVFYILFLNRNNVIKAEKQIFTGGVSATVVDAKIIFKEAINHLASSIILAHNHPSGNLKPSHADKQITQKLKAGSQYFDIQLLDHIIVSHKGYYSFADDGEL